jgi:hypothetical protein
MNNTGTPMLVSEYIPAGRINVDDQGKDGETNTHVNGKGLVA